MTDTASPSSFVAGFRGPVGCRRTLNALTLTGPAADCADDVLILTLIGPASPEIPESLTAAAVSALDERRYRITSVSREWIIEATSVHVHRDIGRTFYRKIPPRRAPLRKRLFWRIVMALARSRAGTRVLLFLRRRR